MMAQNYLKADCPMANPDRDKVPVTSSGNGVWQICYDGQMGNQKELAKAHGLSNGPFQEERLVLHLHQEHGSNMCEYLDDAIFAFVISNGDEIFAARDLLGIKTLFYGRRDNTLYLATELKSLAAVTDDIHEFPPGHYMDSGGSFSRFAELPKAPPEVLHSDLGQMIKDIRDIIQRSLRSRVDFTVPTAGLLSGGMDSSVINYLASALHREKFGKDARLKTFAMGVGESEDIRSARVLADHINSDHHELIVDLEQVVEVLPEVIYYLESFDPSLVRSSVSNFLISKYAREHGIDLLLSGEGGDEIFCGYLYLKDFPPEELFVHQMECIGFLHNNASLRLDRMNHCNSIRVVAPLISGELFRYMLAIPPEYKQKPDGDEKIEKWIFRKAFEPFLPEIITRRLKQEFSQGSGSAALLPDYFETSISDDELAETQAKYPLVRSKEELYYFQLFTDNFGDGPALDTVGQWISL
jgi:asparagine synthase (glutamine-hydrolysing)